MSEKIKFAVVGCGHIGKRHAEVITSNPCAELAALIDIKKIEELNIQDFQVPFFQSLDDFLKSDINADVVNIATPNGLHHQQAMRCLQHDKNILVEKPIALTKHHAEEIIAFAKQQGKQVFTVMQNRYSPPSIWIKSVLEQNLLGEIYMVQANCFWNRDERYYHEKGKEWRGTKALDGGCLFTQFSHFVDILYWLFGDIKNIHSKFNDFNHSQLTEFEDSGVITFDFLKGGTCCFNFSTSVYKSNLESELTIIAEKGSIKIGGQYMNEVQLCTIDNYILPELKSTKQSNDYGAYQGSAANHKYVIQNVVNFLQHKDYSLPQPEESVAVIDMIERMYGSKI